jgi:Tyrosinase co-factor MelC1
MPAFSRRAVLRGAAAAVVASGVAVGVQLAMPESHADDASERVDEVYKGRRIKGVGRSAAGSLPTLAIDDAELHVMVNANGTYVTAINHYQGFASLREAAHAAVDELNGAKLIPMNHHHR